jgi:hypothetical protein
VSWEPCAAGGGRHGNEGGAAGRAAAAASGDGRAARWRRRRAPLPERGVERFDYEWFAGDGVGILGIGFLRIAPRMCLAFLRQLVVEDVLWIGDWFRNIYCQVTGVTYSE